MYPKETHFLDMSKDPVILDILRSHGAAAPFADFAPSREVPATFPQKTKKAMSTCAEQSLRWESCHAFEAMKKVLALPTPRSPPRRGGFSAAGVPDRARRSSPGLGLGLVFSILPPTCGSELEVTDCDLKQWKSRGGDIQSKA